MKFLALLSLIFAGLAQAASPVITLTVTPTAGVGTITPQVTWSVQGASSCAASGAWGGPKAVSGTETLPPQSQSGNVILECVGAKGPATLDWVAPTKNTDGSALTNLSGYRILEGTSAQAMASAANVGLVTTYSFESPIGPRYWAVKAIAGANESALSNTVTKVVVGQVASKTVSFTVTAPAPVFPNSPTGLTVK